MNNSYTATRIHAMAAKLIKNEQYDFLLRMTEQELINYLHENEYRADIDALNINSIQDLDIVDRIIAHNDDRTFKKLDRIASPEFREFLLRFKRENDAWNLKLIAEAITGGSDPVDAIRCYAKRGTIDPMRFTNDKTIQDLCKHIHRIMPIFMPHSQRFPSSLAEFIDQLNTALAMASRAKSRTTHATRTPADMVSLRERMIQSMTRSPALSIAHSTIRSPITGRVGGTQRYCVDEQNIIRVIMLKRDGVPAKGIMLRMQRGGTIRRAVLQQAADAQGVREALLSFRTTIFGKIAERAAEGQTLVKFEYEIHHETLRRIKKHAGIQPLHPDILIKYLVEKDIEAVNLRLIIKGKRLGVDEEFMREQLLRTTA